MGCAQSNEKEENGVDAFLEEEKVKALTNYKVLLLGAGESGKSTVVKQLKVLHKVTMDEQELNSYRISIHNNTVTMMQTFLEAAERFDLLEWVNEEEENLARTVVEFVFEEGKLMPYNIGEAIAKLYQSKTIQATLARRSEFWNLDASDYYFENVMRFVEEDYIPSEEDCIMARVRTTGIVVTDFDDGPVHFKVVDVAGQRSERKKWIHCFDDVKCLVFVVSLAGYNQVMFEDANHNRMHEALNLFQQISNYPVFGNTPIFLFLNKKDLFEKMIQEADLKKCFPEYTGGCDVNAALEFIKQEFKKRMEDDRRLYVHYIAARFKKDIRYTWDDLKNVLIAENKKDFEQAAKQRKKLDKEKSKK